VRFVNKYGIPHFIKEKPYRLVFGKDDHRALSEQWLLRMGVEMPKAQGAGLDLHNQPSTLYNGMISPLAPLAVSGVLWYQGETNTGKAYEYAPMLRLLMANWRQAFGRPELPFVIIQLANYMEPSAQPQNTGWSQLREAQRVVARADSRAELTVTIDLGETVDIHPLRKKEVAQRVATCLDKLVYQNKRVVLSPEVVGCEVADGRIVLTMDQEMQDTDEARFFEVAGADGRFVNTTASVHGRQITVVSPLATPSKLRYAWRNNPLGVNVYGKAGLPLSPLQMDVK
jgi:sialate O-acetylesterase